MYKYKVQVYSKLFLQRLDADVLDDDGEILQGLSCDREVSWSGAVQGPKVQIVDLVELGLEMKMLR